MTFEEASPPPEFPPAHLAALIEWVWTLSSAPYALYLRGSAARSGTDNGQIPWDTDIYLFVEDGGLPSMSAIEIALSAAGCFPTVPPLDLSCFELGAFSDHDRFALQKLAFQYDARLARGRSVTALFPPPELNPHTARRMSDNVAPFLYRKVEIMAVAAAAGHPTSTLAKTMATCAKGILRSIAILQVANGDAYIRTPAACLAKIKEMFPNLSDDADVMLSAMTGEVEFEPFHASATHILDVTILRDQV